MIPHSAAQHNVFLRGGGPLFSGKGPFLSERTAKLPEKKRFFGEFSGNFFRFSRSKEVKERITAEKEVPFMLKPSFLPAFLLLLFALALMVACGTALSQVFLSMRAPALLRLLPY